MYASTELFDAYTDLYGPWTPGPNMAAARCGHAAGVGDKCVWVFVLKGGREGLDRPQACTVMHERAHRHHHLQHSHDVYVMGGYGGGTNYLASVEVLPGGVIGEQGRGFVPLEEEGASMSAPRTGFAMSKGPDRAFYVAGACLGLLCRCGGGGWCS